MPLSKRCHFAPTRAWPGGARRQGLVAPTGPPWFATGRCAVEPGKNDYAVPGLGRWLAADPFFLQALAGWGVVDPGEWPRYRSPQHALWRLGSGYAPLIRNGATPTGATVAFLEAGTAMSMAA